MSAIRPVTFKTRDISQAELAAACRLVNDGGQLSIVLTEERLQEVYFLITAMQKGEVVGTTCIKKHDTVAEIGYTAVKPECRRLHIGQRMTELLKEHALKQKIEVLCGMVYHANLPNRKKLEKLGFFKFSEFLSRSGDAVLCWYCHPLRLSKSKASVEMEQFILQREQRLAARA